MGDIRSVGYNGDGMQMVGEANRQQDQAGMPRRHDDFKRAFSHAMNAAISSSQLSNESDAPPAVADEETKLRWAARQLETMFMQELFKGMRRTIPEGGLFERSFSLQTYQEMLDDELAKSMSLGGGIGLSEVILQQLRG